MIRMMCLMVAMMLVVLIVQPGMAQDDPLVAFASRGMNVRSQPGQTFGAVGRLNEGAAVRLIERNRAGTWLRVQQFDGGGVVTVDGWVLGGYLRLDPSLAYSQLPVNATVADADAAAFGPSLARMYAVPVIPVMEGDLLDSVQVIFARGQALGIRPNSVTKVGDSLSADPLYLTVISREQRDYGVFDTLIETVDFFRDSTVEPSIAANVGMATYTVLDPQWAPDDRCQPAESPLTCEYRHKMPVAAFILFGPNDMLHVSADYFREQLRQIVVESITNGVIPVLSTFSINDAAENANTALQFNLVVLDLAAEYHVPVINLWLAARPLPEFGLEGDGVHMQLSGFAYLKLSRGDEAWYGATLRNLLALTTLRELYVTLELADALTVEPTATQEAEQTDTPGG